MEIDLNSPMNQLTTYIRGFDNVLEKKLLNTFKKICQSDVNYTDAKIMSAPNDPISERTDKNVRNVGVYGLSNFKEKSLTMVHWSSLLTNVFQNKIKSYIKQLNINSHANINDIQILKYGVGGHYKMHVDSGPRIYRTLSLIYFLNDDYEGGNLCFGLPNTDVTFDIPKKDNRLIIWPSNFMYPHTVTPVTKGERYSVVAWAQ